MGTVSAQPAAAEYEDLLCQYPWDCARAYRIMMCESEGIASKVDSGNYGLMQVNQVHRAMVNGNLDALLDPETNVAVAFRLYQQRGWTPWVYCSQR